MICDEMQIANDSKSHKTGGQLQNELSEYPIKDEKKEEKQIRFMFWQ